MWGYSPLDFAVWKCRGVSMECLSLWQHAPRPYNKYTFKSFPWCICDSPGWKSKFTLSHILSTSSSLKFCITELLLRARLTHASWTHDHRMCLWILNGSSVIWDFEHSDTMQQNHETATFTSCSFLGEYTLETRLGKCVRVGMWSLHLANRGQSHHLCHTQHCTS